MRKLDERHKRIALWAATGSTMAVIIALWAMVLPMQMERIRAESSKGVSRWGTQVIDAETETKKTFAEVLAEQRMLLNELERKSNESVPVADDLRFRIEDATVAKSVTKSGEVVE